MDGNMWKSCQKHVKYLYYILIHMNMEMGCFVQIPTKYTYMIQSVTHFAKLFVGNVSTRNVFATSNFYSGIFLVLHNLLGTHVGNLFSLHPSSPLPVMLIALLFINMLLARTRVLAPYCYKNMIFSPIQRLQLSQIIFVLSNP